MAITKVSNELIAINAIHGTLIADNAITAVHIATNAVSGLLIADNALTAVHIATDAVTPLQIQADAVTAAKLATNAVVTASIVAGSVTATELGADAVTGAKIADDAIDSEHYTDGSIDAAHLADDAVTIAKMAAITRGSIIAGNASGAPAALALGSNNYVLTSDGTDIAWASSQVEESPAFTGNVTVGGTLGVTGAATFTTNMTQSSGIFYPNTIHFADNEKAMFGGGEDLNIFHDGSHSYLHQSGVGDLRVRAAIFGVNNAANDETMIHAAQDGAVNLYYNGSGKLATATNGISVTGSVISTGNFSTSGITEMNWYNATNNANPTLNIGSSSAERLLIQAVYASGAQTLSKVSFRTYSSLGSADAGKYVFGVDEVDVFQIDDGGIEVTGAITGNLTGNASGTAATVTTAAQPNITSLGTLTTLTVDNITLNGDTISHGGGLIIDCTGDMVLDAEGGEIRFKDNGTEFGNVSSYNNNLWFHSSVQDKDIAFRGDDGGSSITALNLDMSDAGAASFNSSVICATSARISQVAITSSSAAIAWNAYAAANAYHVTTENTTFSAPSNATEGAIISVEIAQGGTARTIAWNTVFEFAASTAPTITATANKTDILTFRYNGSVWQEIGRVQNMAQT